jgi:hypothetical protein
MTEQPVAWRKSTFSGSDGDCVELAGTAEGFALRNSNRIDDGTLTFTGAELAAFVTGCRAGEFDSLLAPHQRG